MSEEGSSQARNAKNQGPGAEWFQSAATGDVETLRDFAEVAIDNDLDVKDSRGYTALMIAAMKGHVAGVRLLAQYGADLNAADSRGWTATTHAAFNGQHGCLSLLAEGGADLDAKDFLGTTAAIRAALGGHEHCLMVLADHGADLLTVDNLGMAAMVHAQRNGHDACIMLLEEKVSFPGRRRYRSSSKRTGCRSTFHLATSAAKVASMGKTSSREERSGARRALPDRWSDDMAFTQWPPMGAVSA